MPGSALWRALRRLLRRQPWPAGALLDVAADEATNDLGGRRVLLGAQALEQGLLARIDEDRQSCGAVFERQDVIHGYYIKCIRIIIQYSPE